MARKDALLKLHARLVMRKRELLGTIEEQLGALRNDHGGQTGDDIDVASVSMNSELTSQLAEHESRELMNIERALYRLREGSYGNCEVCDKKIPIERLNVVPYTTVCVDCQRELETNPELREELENKHERELAALAEDDEDDETHDSDVNGHDDGEIAQETRTGRRRGGARKSSPPPAAKPAPKPAPQAAKTSTTSQKSKPKSSTSTKATAKPAKATAKPAKAVSRRTASKEPARKARVSATAHGAKNGKRASSRATALTKSRKTSSKSKSKTKTTARSR